MWEVEVWSGLKFLKITGGRHLWMRWWTFGLNKMRGISWIAEKPLASQEGLCCMEWVSITFCDMPLVPVDYTIHAVWSFCNNQLTVIIERTTRTASGAEEMLLHVAIRSAGLIIVFICLSILLTHALHRMECWKWLPGVLKLLPSDYCLHIAI